MRRFVPVLFAALAACSDGGTTDTQVTIPPLPDTTDSGTTETTTDDPPGGVFLDAVVFFVDVKFGFDPDLGKAVDFANPDEGFSPLEVEVTLLSDDYVYLGKTDTNNCSVRLTAEGPIGAAQWAVDYGAWWGLDFPADAVVDDGCANFGLPAEFQGDAGALVSRWTYGAAVTELSDVQRKDLSQRLEPSQWAALEDYALGGVLRAGFLTAQESGADTMERGYATAFSVDNNFEIITGGAGATIPILATEVQQPEGLARAYYDLQMGPFDVNWLFLTP